MVDIFVFASAFAGFLSLELLVMKLGLRKKSH